jgi:hypothetical protein
MTFGKAPRCVRRKQAAMGVDQKTCSDNLDGARKSRLNLDFCYFASRRGEPPPADWKVPTGCTSGPCLVTPSYCKSVGYADMSRSVVPSLVATMRKQIAQNPGSTTAEQNRTVLRVCLRASVITALCNILRSASAIECTLWFEVRACEFTPHSQARFILSNAEKTNNDQTNKSLADCP